MPRIVPYEKSFAVHEKSKFWNYEKNDDKPEDYSLNSHKKVWFTCPKCSHNFEIIISTVTRGSFCSYCCFPPQKLCQDDCEMCFNNSFASNPKNICWDYEKNKLTPREVFKCAYNKYWFICISCDHSYEIQISKIPTKDNFCVYCSNRKLCEKDCDICRNKSFAMNKKSKYWLYEKNECGPHQVSKSSNRKFWFKHKCRHEFDMIIGNIHRGQFCPYCSSSPKKLCDNNDCDLCFNKSFASSSLLIYWDYKKNKLNPREIFKNSANKYWFVCENQHEFYMSLAHINNDRFCPFCVNKTETKFYEEIQLYQPNIVRQFKADWCKNRFTNKHLPFDFVLEDLKIIIEIDGPQHFRQISNWDSNKKTRLKDIYKMNCSNKNGYRVIRIIQEDIFYDRTNWLTDVLNAINHQGNVFICYNDEYVNHKDLTQLNPYDDDSELTLSFLEDENIEDVEDVENDENDENEDKEQETTKNIILFNGLILVDDLADV